MPIRYEVPDEMPKTLRIKDLAQLLDVTPATVHNMLKNGRIPVEPIPRSKPRRWLATEVEAWLHGRTASRVSASDAA